MAVDLWSAMLTLFLIMDPLGNLPIVVAILKNIKAERRMKVLVRELLLSLVILLLFLYGGQAFLSVLGVKEEAVSIAGGIILFLIALRMIFPPPPQDSPVPVAEPLIVPLAIPALAGPSAMATVLLLVSQAPERRLEWVAALTVTMVVCAGVLLMAERLQQVVGERVVSAFERLMGLILVSISVEMLIRGLQSLALRWPHA